MYRQRFPTEPYVIRLPEPPDPPINPHAFVMCALPPGLSVRQWLCQQWLYQRAFEQAKAVVRPSLVERDLLAVWN